MKYFSLFVRGFLLLSFYASVSLFAYADNPPYVAWRICDFPEGTSNNPSGSFYMFGNKAVCLANRSLFGTDGTLEGTYAITDRIDALPGHPGAIVQYKSHGYYRKFYSQSINGLGRTNYEAGNDALFWEPEPGPEINFLSPIAVVGGYLLFVHGRSLCRTDGSETGTVCIYNFSSTYELTSSGSFFTGIIVEGNYLYFLAGPTNGTHGLWRTDGTATGTINLMQRSSAPLSTLAGGNGWVFFTESQSTGARLWKTDGTAQGTQQILAFPFQSPTGSSLIISSSYSNGRLWFGVFPMNELWYSDGTTAGTQKVRSFQALPKGYGRQMQTMQAVGDRLLFTAIEGELVHYLWGSDGTEQGTFKLTNGETSNGWTSVHFYGQLEDNVLFGAGSSPNHEIWVGDGTESGTRKISDTVQTFSSPMKYNDHYLMIGKDTNTPVGLWGLREDVPFQFRTQPRARQHYYEGGVLDLFVNIPSWYESTASYQWFKDNLPLAGEDSKELFIGMLTQAESGSYFCRVTLEDKTAYYDSETVLIRVFAEGSLPLLSKAYVLFIMLMMCGTVRFFFYEHIKGTIK